METDQDCVNLLTFTGRWNWAPGVAKRVMPIRQYLNGEQFDLETTRVVGVAFEVARAALRAEERGERTDETIAKHIIALAQSGERDADRLCDYALAKLRERDGRSSQLFQASSETHAAALRPNPRT